MQPLAPIGNTESQANTNFSTSISLSALDQYGNDVSIHASKEHPIEFIIPRDTNLIMSPMFLQNVTSISNNHNLQFKLHSVNITLSNNNLTASLHLDMYPLNTSLGYLLIYKFDNFPQFIGSINQTDGWSLFCPFSKLFLF